VREIEVCPNCSARFEAREWLTSSGISVALGAIVLPGVSAEVKCPGCGRKFFARTLRFFGFLSPNALRWAMLSVVVLVVAVAVGSSLG
jgi:hypothetical protein